MFSGELERVSAADRPQATATLNAAVRKAGGGEEWIPLASWSGTQPVETFFQAARVAWRSLPKEDDDYRKVIVDDKRFDTEPSGSRQGRDHVSDDDRTSSARPA